MISTEPVLFALRTIPELLPLGKKGKTTGDDSQVGKRHLQEIQE